MLHVRDDKSMFSEEEIHSVDHLNLTLQDEKQTTHKASPNCSHLCIHYIRYTQVCVHMCVACIAGTKYPRNPG